MYNKISYFIINSEWYEIKRFFITIAFQPHFRICH